MATSVDRQWCLLWQQQLGLKHYHRLRVSRDIFVGNSSSLWERSYQEPPDFS
jgi:hypothetical protein